MKGIIPQGRACGLKSGTRHHHRSWQWRLSAASYGVLTPSFPHSLDHVRASTVAISLRSSITPRDPEFSPKAEYVTYGVLTNNEKKFIVGILEGENMSNEANTVWHSLLNHNVLIIWKPEYNLGIPIIDEQHRGIVTTINSLHYGMQHNHGESMLRPVIGMVTDYTRIHFETEEYFLKTCKFPGFDAHHELHNELTRKLDEIGNKSLWYKDPDELMNFLKNWWIDHICVKDRIFRDYLHSKQ